ncbi:MAG TPA: LysM peptidoglycan-binding domain-containing protein [Anaerolineales bacterium]|nr:LysM peptidoglycan-binding domain-containing protein [Anaerolineales bacterium]
MARKTQFLLALLALVLVLSFAAPGKALAWYGCGSTYTVQWGNTLYSIARKCGTTVSAIQQANPGLGTYIYAGQVLYMPGYYNSGYVPLASSGTYVVQPGDSMKKIAAKFGVCVSDLIAANPQIPNPNIIYAGQVIYIPASSSSNCTSSYYPPTYYPPTYPSSYTVQWGDTLSGIAYQSGTSVYYLMQVNPQIANPHWIYAGQVIRIQ